MLKIPYVTLTDDSGQPVHLKATNILSVSKYQTFSTNDDPFLTVVTVNHKEFFVKESQEKVLKLIQEAINE